MTFEENVGQLDPEVRFLARGRGYQVFLTGSDVVLVRHRRPAPSGTVDRPLSGVGRAPAGIRRDVVRISLVGAQPSAPHGSRPAGSQVNYLRSADASRWRRQVPAFAQVEYRAVYPGIDLVYYGNQHRLEYDFIIAAGADPKQIALQFDGASSVTLDEAGDLRLATAGEDVVVHSPVIYQEFDGRRRRIEGKWTIDARGHARFLVGAYDPARRLVIDPIIDFATYLGGSGAEDGLDNMGVTVDASGHIYIAGTTDSADFPGTGGIQTQFAGTTDAFVVKLDPTASTTIFATYIGGSGLDSGQALAIDGNGNIYVGGFTDSTDFPTQTPLQGTIGGSFDGFVAKLNPSGSALLYSTYIGGNARDFVLGLDVNDQGEVYLAGDVESDNFPTANALQPAWGGVWDAWAAKVSASGDRLLFSTYLGGSSADAGLDVKVDADGFVYVAGFTISTDFPTAGAAQDAVAGDADAYVLKLQPDGSSFVYSTYLGGGSTDRALGIDVDDFGNAYVVGDTLSDDFPAVNPIVGFAGFADAFIAKFTASGSVAYTTFVGGGVADHGLAIAVDRSGNAHITGMTFSDTFLLVQPLQQEIAGDVDAFVSSVDASGTRVMFSTFLGGVAGERGLAIAADGAGNIVVVGDTFSNDFPTVRPIQADLDGLRDIFVVKIRQAVDVLDPAIKIEQRVTGLLAPRAMVRIGTDDWLVLENRGWIRRVINGVINPDPVLQLPVNGNIPGRPYGFVLHPSFPATPLVYVYFSEVDTVNNLAPLGHRLYSYTWSGSSLHSPQMLLHIPLGPASGSETGTMAFGPDGKLYLTSGDTGTQSQLQNVAGGIAPNDTGVIMRLNPDGTAPSDNPFATSGGNAAKYVGYGIHSSSALAFDPVNGNLWAGDNGITKYDELNLVLPGFNGGWSALHSPISRHVGSPPALVAFPGSAYRDPLFSWRVPVLPSAMTFVDGEQVGDHYRNHLFVGSAINGSLYHFKPKTSRNELAFIGTGMVDLIADNDVEASEFLFATGFGSIADIEAGDDGLYVLSSALGSIFRVFWESDVELKLSASQTSIPKGGMVPVDLDIENKTNERQDIALLLSMRIPTGEEFPVVGPLPLSLEPRARITAQLPVSVPAQTQTGTWTFKGLIARPQASEPDIVDVSAVDFDVIP